MTICCVPECDVVLSARNTSGVCQEHNHYGGATAGFCKCRGCERKRENQKRFMLWGEARRAKRAKREKREKIRYAGWDGDD